MTAWHVVAIMAAVFVVVFLVALAVLGRAWLRARRHEHRHRPPGPLFRPAGAEWWPARCTHSWSTTARADSAEGICVLPAGHAGPHRDAIGGAP